MNNVMKTAERKVEVELYLYLFKMASSWKVEEGEFVVDNKVSYWFGCLKRKKKIDLHYRL